MAVWKRAGMWVMEEWRHVDIVSRRVYPRVGIEAYMSMCRYGGMEIYMPTGR